MLAAVQLGLTTAAEWTTSTTTWWLALPADAEWDDGVEVMSLALTSTIPLHVEVMTLGADELDEPEVARDEQASRHDLGVG